MIFNSKAQNLLYLKNKAKRINVLPLLCFSFSEYKKNKTAFLNQIINTFQSDVIIRSSAYNEDNEKQSNAGVYQSVLNVKPTVRNLKKAIEIVGNDYLHKEDEILIQPMLQNILASGVVFTRDHSTGAPYYIINYTKDGKTNTITSGLAQGQKIIISRLKKLNAAAEEIPLKQLLKTVRQIERIFRSDTLDIEFAFDTQQKLYILQVRPLVIQEAYSKDDIFSEHLQALYREIKTSSKKKSGLAGKNSIYSMMTDWNPAEMIGARPNLLALSLYRNLITDNVWAIQRKNYGYKDVAPHPLLYSFSGCPYIDVRTDFNSFLPANLSAKTAHNIMKYYLNVLARHPEWHDKAEFCILFTCATLTTSESVRKKFANVLSQRQIEEFIGSLRKITDNIFKPSATLYQQDISSVKKAEALSKSILREDICFEEKIKKLLKLCREHGTLPFAGIARTAFIGRQFMDSFVEKKIISPKNYRDFFRSIPIISREIRRDAVKLRNKEMTLKTFLNKWGHLRPSSYDILSLRYDEDFASYFGEERQYKPLPKQVKKFAFSSEQIQRIDDLLQKEGLHFSAEHLIKCIEESIIWREKSKFIFTKVLSQILSLIKEYARTLSVTKEDIAYVSIADIVKQFKTSEEKQKFLLGRIKAGKTAYAFTKCVKLPEVLISPADIFCFMQSDNIPNYITQKKVIADVVAEEKIHNTNCCNKIVCIRAADPGYDFIFTQNISGLVTQFGGANSHMAIRCLEQNIPAVIGAGEKLFNELKEAETIEIDGLNKLVRIIK